LGIVWSSNYRLRVFVSSRSVILSMQAQAQQSMGGASPTIVASPATSTKVAAAAGPSGFKIAASIVAAVFASALLVVMTSPSRPAAAQTTVGVHYMPTRPFSHPTVPEQVMTNEAGGVHYLVRHTAGPAPTLAPMTPGYKAFTEVAPHDVRFVKWVVAVGDIVQVGDPLLVFSRSGRREELRASAAGRIKELADVSEGERVNTATKLVIVGHPGPALDPVVSCFVALVAVLILVAFVAHVRSLPAYEQVASQEKSMEEGLAPKAEDSEVSALRLKAKGQDPAAASGLPRVMRAAAETSKARAHAEDARA